MDRIIGDSFKILPTLADKSIEMILTDPPYDLDKFRMGWLHE